MQVGMLVAKWGPHLEVDVSRALNARKAPAELRLTVYRRLASKVFEPGGKAVLEDFRAWAKGARELCKLRNEYVHGRWALPLRDDPVDPLLAFCPLGWDFSAERPTQTREIRMSALAAQVAALEGCGGTLAALERSHVAFARPAAWLERGLASSSSKRPIEGGGET